jgi:hypothetical protein
MYLRVTRSLTWVPLAMTLIVGCQSHPEVQEDQKFEDDFGTELESPPITAASVSESEMLHRRARLEPLIGVAVPVVGNFDPGIMAGVRGELEAFKNIFWGVSFDWVHSEVGTGVSDILDSGGSLEAADADQWYESADRYNLLINLSWETPIERDFLGKDQPLLLRLGLGLGTAIVVGNDDPAIARLGYHVFDYFGFVARPEVDLHWKVLDWGRLVFGIGYDFVYPDWIGARIDGEEKTVDGDVDFSAFFARLGFICEF